jgi:multidrug efflux pump subunit AcrA (membrane-fusion protein)
MANVPSSAASRGASSSSSSMSMPTSAVVPPARPRRLLRLGIPALVIAGMGGLLALSAGESLRPVPGVAVHAVVFDPSRPDATLVARGQDAAASGAASGRADEQRGRFAGRGGGAAVQAPGWLEADPFLIACTALTDGVVAEMLVLEGQPVEAGQVVARMVPDDAALVLADAEAELAARRADLAAAEADLAAARTDWDEPVERERAVAASEARLARIAAELEQLPYLIAAEVAQREALADEAARARQAQRAGAATEIEAIILEKQAESRAGTIAALRSREQILAAERRAEEAEGRAARRNLELRVTERRALDAAAAGLARAEAAVRRAEVHVATAQLRLDRMVIRAPITGYVQRRLKAPGDKVMLAMDEPHSAHLVHLYDPASIQVRVDVPLADAANLFVGQTCEVVVEVLPGETFRGEVTRITHEADLQKNTLQAKVRVIDPSPLLRPEMLTRVKFLAGRPAAEATDAAGESDDVDGTRPSMVQAGLRVPVPALAGEDAVGARSRVWLVRDRRGGRGTLEAHDVDIVAREGELAVIAGDLRAGDLVADAAAARAEGIDLRAGLRIRLMAAPAAGSGGAS